MTITYEYYHSLYVNLTNRCSNACTFCVRNKHDDVNGKDNLWLEREPSLEEIKADFEKRDLSKYASVVFCGYGEPAMRFDDVIVIAKWLKEKQPDLPIRINTNGQANLICKRDVTPEMAGCIDCVSISLNAENPEKYQKLCQSEFGGETAFSGILDFAARAVKYVPEVVFSVVDIMPEAEIEACRKIAQDCGVKFRVREFIK
ncbi:TIGR04100 family radical SAM protein [Ructibacterium gallinarum]|uniref:TIGR04100 family radical SAM protein n=1 Tax=Ructibacterium gallinarum TaxID=2779355 RepID=A0A9D5M6C6_9FIRM|nr:TIGR04100 family radical SAM protein [Ructibacterium gallinarum]MBE5040384.1 TIGR04100 family radical SAM protein [Ructibacterium gallinarum]